MAELNYLVGGEAGQGVQTVGALLSKIMARHGLYVFSDQDYESRVRGGHSFFRIRISQVPVGAISEDLDVLIGLDQRTIEIHQSELKKDGVIIYDPDKVKTQITGSQLIGIPFEKIAVEACGNKVMANSVAIGAAVAVGGYDLQEALTQVFNEQFARLGVDIVEGNQKAARAGYDQIKKQPDFIKKSLGSSSNKMMLIDGNTAAGIGAMAAGCKFVSGYPMTPTSPILEYIADKGRSYNVIMLQPEDEIAAINMVIGASYAGVRAMTATSGGGFCLMVEGLSLAGMTETPVVCILGQRPGPAIGLPTRTEQGELLFSLFSGHGEFPRAVLTPATIEDYFYTTVKAFNLAEKYQVPVIVLTDQHLGASLQTVNPFDLGKVMIDRGELISEDDRKHDEYKRYQYSESGISPRAIPLPGGPLVVIDSDEHNEEGHIIEDAETRTNMMDKRLRKIRGLVKEITPPWYSERPGANILLIGWGSTFGAISEAADLLEKDGIHASVLQLTQVWPFPAEQVTGALSKNEMKTFVVENNATGQLAKLIRAETGIATESILKYDGRPFSPSVIVKAVEKEVKKTW